MANGPSQARKKPQANAAGQQRPPAPGKPGPGQAGRAGSTPNPDRRLVFTLEGWAEYMHWMTADRATLKTLHKRIDEALRGPGTGIGKPEQLRHLPDGAWSRHISEEHRLVYRLDGNDIVI